MEVRVCEGKVLASRLQRKLKEVRRWIFFNVNIMSCYELPEYSVVLVPRPEVRALNSHGGIYLVCPQKEKSDQITALELVVSVKINHVLPSIFPHLLYRCLLVCTQGYPYFSHYGSSCHIEYHYFTLEQSRRIKISLILVKDCLDACLR